MDHHHSCFNTGAALVWRQPSSSSTSSSPSQPQSQPTPSSSLSSETEPAGGLIPDIAVITLDISNIDKDRVDGTSRILFKNPLPVEISMNRIDYGIFIDSVRVVKDAYNRPLKIGASDSAVIEVPMKTSKNLWTGSSNILKSIKLTVPPMR